MNKSSNATTKQKPAFIRNIMFAILEVKIFLYNQISRPKPIKPKIQPGMFHPILQKSPVTPKSKVMKSNNDINFIKISNVIITETILTIIFTAFFIVTLLSKAPLCKGSCQRS